MMRATKTMHVEVKPDRVLSFLIDSSVHPPGMTVEAVYESPAVLGNSYEWNAKMFGMRRKGVMVVTDYVPGERLAFRNFSGAFEGSSTWIVEPENGGSKATAQAEARLAVPLVGRLFDPLLQRMWEKQLEWGKSEIEKQLEAK